MAGSQIEALLSGGTLTLTLPGGTSKTFEQVPPADPMGGMTFESFSNSPGGPQIRIPLEQLPDVAVTGQYQVSWRSGSLQTITLEFDWDGQMIVAVNP